MDFTEGKNAVTLLMAAQSAYNSAAENGNGAFTIMSFEENGKVTKMTLTVEKGVKFENGSKIEIVRHDEIKLDQKSTIDDLKMTFPKMRDETRIALNDMVNEQEWMDWATQGHRAGVINRGLQSGPLSIFPPQDE